MISTAAELLLAIKIKEEEILKENKIITHAPTIGDMYEGLTQELLDRVLPSNIDIKVVTGFVKGSKGELSPQIDLMIVTGQGEQIPRTNKYIYPVQSVLAVFEVKKNLYAADLEDAFDKQKSVMHIHRDYLDSIEDSIISCGAAYKAFANLTGHFPSTAEAIKLLPEELQLILEILVHEQLAPVRVIFGYEGYISEKSLRDGFIKFLNQRIRVHGTGPTSLPNLIVCRNNSILKSNGQPYISPMQGGKWDLLNTNSENPLRLLLELLLTKISNFFKLSPPQDDNLEEEVFAHFVSAELGSLEGQQGWKYWFTDFKFKEAVKPESKEWQPHQGTEAEWVVMMRAITEGRLRVDDPKLIDYLKREGHDPKDFLNKMIGARLLAWENETTLRPISQDFISVMTPDGETYISDSSHPLGYWFEKTKKKDL